VLVALVVVWALVAFVPSYRLTTLRSGGPDWVDGVTQAQEACRAGEGDRQVVPISPPPDWLVELSCSALGEQGPGAA
jgi:hypothetical protein